jgi:hypothetical protein
MVQGRRPPRRPARQQQLTRQLEPSTEKATRVTRGLGEFILPDTAVRTGQVQIFDAGGLPPVNVEAAELVR